VSHYFTITFHHFNSVTCLPIALKSCSNVQKMREVFWNALKKTLESFDFQVFVGDVISGIDFKPFWLRLPGPECEPLD